MSEERALPELLRLAYRRQPDQAGESDEAQCPPIASLAENAGFSVGELFGARGRGKSAAIKFQNPDNRSETWTGRGRKPNWLVAKLNKGAKIQDFAV